jgi:sensor c-di-GMP phosphodiesterase-like protein
MNSRRSYIVKFLALAFSIGTFVFAAHASLAFLIDSQNWKHLRELNELALRRTELAVDYAFLALGELVEGGITGCDEATLGKFRRQVYVSSTVKDIRIVDGDGRAQCSAFPETLNFDASRISKNDTIAGRNPQVRLFRLERESGVALGVMWEAIDQVLLVAVVNVDALLFDTLPPELRDNAAISVKLANGSGIASYAPSNPTRSIKAPNVISATSERYPLVSTIAVDAATLNRWNKEAEPLFLGVGGAVGLVFGLLLVRITYRPKSALSQLDDALAAKQFRPFMQPVFSLKTREIVGCEVLARWVRDDGAVAPPSRFIPLAEEHGRIEPLTWQIVSEALADLRPRMQSHKSFKVAFNIAPAHLMRSGFVDDFRKVVSDARVSARQVVVEVTEHEELQNLAQAAEVVAALREHGFKVAIDDVGTGHSGLSYIQALGANTIKIDKFFVDAIGKDHTATAVVEMLVRLARELGMTTVAEGIESEQQMASLDACGVDEGQGYLVSPAVPAAQFLGMLQARDGSKPDAPATRANSIARIA